MVEKQTSGKRWYNRYPNIAQIFELTEGLPYSVQCLIGHKLLMLVRHYQTALAPEHQGIYNALHFKILGREVALHYYKSKNRNRWYDTVPELHKASYTLLTLPQAALEHLDVRCSEIVEEIHLHLAEAVTKSAKSLPQLTSRSPRIQFTNNEAFLNHRSLAQQVGRATASWQAGPRRSGR